MNKLHINLIIIAILFASLTTTGIVLAGSPPTEAIPTSYQIETNGTTIWAINGETGVIDYSGTDAVTVIQDAVDALTDGGSIFIKKGTYVFTDVPNGTRLLEVTQDGIFISGEGYSTIIEMKENAKTIHFDGVSAGGVSNIRFEGEPTDDENHGIFAVDSEFIQVDNNYFNRFGDESVVYSRVNQSSIFRNIFNGSNGAGSGGGIDLQATNTTDITLNKFMYPGHTGIHIEQTQSTKGSHYITVSLNQIISPAKYGIFVSSTDQAHNNTDIGIFQNTISDAGLEHIRIAGGGISTPKNILVSGNLVTGGGNDPSGTQRAAIIVTQKTNPANTMAFGNMVIDYGTDSGSRRGIQGFDVYLGNSVSGSGDIGLFVSSNSIVLGNYCINNGVSGLGSRAGIQAGHNNSIALNFCTNTDPLNMVQKRGIRVTGDNNMLLANYVEDNISQAIDDDGSLNLFHYNTGFAAPNDWIQSITCGAGESITGYDNSTGYFTCSVP